MQCPQCGRETAAGDQRCSACGHELTKALTRLKNPLVRKRLLLLGGGLFVVLALLVFLLFLLPDRSKKEFVRRPANLGGELTGEKQDAAAQYGRKGVELGPNAVYGQITLIRRGVITVKSLNTGKEYTIYVGHRTNYNPRRYPVVGERVKVVYIDDQGRLKATLVEIQT